MKGIPTKYGQQWQIGSEKLELKRLTRVKKN
jgi:hypothetical protein